MFYTKVIRISSFSLQFFYNANFSCLTHFIKVQCSILIFFFLLVFGVKYDLHVLTGFVSFVQIDLFLFFSTIVCVHWFRTVSWFAFKSSWKAQIRPHSFTSCFFFFSLARHLLRCKHVH